MSSSSQLCLVPVWWPDTRASESECNHLSLSSHHTQKEIIPDGGAQSPDRHTAGTQARRRAPADRLLVYHTCWGWADIKNANGLIGRQLHVRGPDVHMCLQHIHSRCSAAVYVPCKDKIVCHPEWYILIHSHVDVGAHACTHTHNGRLTQTTRRSVLHVGTHWRWCNSLSE